MREILFKAKRVDNGEWMEGFYFIDLENKLPYIMLKARKDTVKDWMIKSLVVIPETVSQFTGMTDKNGVNIFENDIVINSFNEKVVCNYAGCSFVFGESEFDFEYGKDVEVIGNIYDKNIIDFKQLQLETAKNVLITLGKDIKRVKEEFNKKQNESDISPTGSIRPV